jgi:D-aspartate ligase
MTSPQCSEPRVSICRTTDSVCQPAFTGIKERSYPAAAGLTSLGRSVANEKLRDQITSMLQRLGYRGLLDLDIRLDSRDGQYNLLDFNPRLVAQFRIFRDTAGTDLDLILAANGIPLNLADELGR